jgi:hypothetical protein
MHELTGIYWIKNETPYLPEWVEFHLLQGFDHFIFYDNGSTDGLLYVMDPYIKSGIVEIRYYPYPLPPARSGPPGSKNFWVMDYCIEEQRGKSKWIHFHAVDEFTFMRDGSSIVDFLPVFEHAGALSIEWELFNSNGHIKRPAGLTIENFTTAYPDPNHHVKTIIMPDKAYSTMGNPHNFQMLPGYESKMEDGTPIPGPWSPGGNRFNIIKNHHYVTRSKEEFDAKNNKGLLDHAHTENVPRSMHFQQEWDNGNNNPEIYVCNDLLKYVGPVREAIAKRYYGQEHRLAGVNH